MKCFCTYFAPIETARSLWIFLHDLRPLMYFCTRIELLLLRACLLLKNLCSLTVITRIYLNYLVYRWASKPFMCFWTILALWCSLISWTFWVALILLYWHYNFFATNNLFQKILSALRISTFLLAQHLIAYLYTNRTDRITLSLNASFFAKRLLTHF